LELARAARQRIWIQTFVFEHAPVTAELTALAERAQQAGVDVRLMYDAFSHYVMNDVIVGLTLPFSQRRRQVLELVRATKRLLAPLPNHYVTRPAGAVMRCSPIPVFLGRDHRKQTIIDDIAYIGGANLGIVDARRTDLMLKTDNPAIVRTLARIF